MDKADSCIQAEQKEKQRCEELGLSPGRWWEAEAENGWKLFQLFLDEDSETDGEDK